VCAVCCSGCYVQCVYDILLFQCAQCSTGAISAAATTVMSAHIALAAAAVSSCHHTDAIKLLCSSFAMTTTSNLAL
jgi:hypothetical protein